MRKVQFLLVAVFLVITVVFAVFFSYDRLVMDHSAPQIVCDGVPLRLSANATDAELCAGLTAYDDVDGDLTDRIIVRKISKLTGSSTATIYYAVFDSASNYCTFTRTVSYTDYSKPHFSLSKPLNYSPNSGVTLKDRLTAFDVIDGDISSRIRVSSNSISIGEPGQYPLDIQVTNSSGDTSVLTLPVLIEATTGQHPTIQLSEYLHYIPRGSDFTEEDMRNLIVAVRETDSGKAADAANVVIEGVVDTQRFGSYPITYSYTNDRGFTRTIILTVVVE